MEGLFVERTQSYYIVGSKDLVGVVDLLQETRLRDLESQPGELL